MRVVTGAVPLFALPVVALDLETTGLDVETARIVQIGALQLGEEDAATTTSFDRLVDPGQPIPPEAAAIHGINDAMVATEPGLAELWAELRAFTGRRVVVGHTIAYDLTVLEREATRLGLPWERPRALCVRKLAAIAIPALHDPSLDKLAAWLGIEIGQRHQALGDAKAAGQIFRKMIPLLAERGIRTLAEAERAVLARAAQREQEAAAGWIAQAPPDSEAILADAGQYDTYAYRHAVGDVMARVLLVVGGRTSLMSAMQRMVERGASSVLVADPPESGRMLDAYGILTERDALRHIANEGAAALDTEVERFMHRPLISIREKAYVYRAIARMRRWKVRHLAVVDEVGDVVGMISARDLLKLRSEPAIALSDAIKEARSSSEMAVAWAGLAGVVRSLTHEGLDARTTARIVSEELRSMTERACDLAVAAMRHDGLGVPPCPFAVMVLGSGGRGESLLKPDQDNAIVFAEGDPDGSVDRWFAELGNRMASILDAAGIPLCNGGVMAKNPGWRGSTQTWRARIEAWVASANPESLLNVDIFFDQIAVAGARRLAHELFAHAYSIGSSNPIFAKLLGAKLDRIANPFGFMGRISGDNGMLDLKLHALFPIVSSARTLAIRHNLPAHATSERLAKLAELGRGDAALLRSLADDHGFCLALILRRQSQALLSGDPLSNAIRLSDLSRSETARLREALKRIQLLPNLVRDMMF
jgi:CBS domain-containing protein